MAEQQELLVDYEEEETFPQAAAEEAQADDVNATDKPAGKFTGGADDEEDEDEPGHTTNEIASFKDFMLRNEINKAIVDCGFEHPSKVQRRVIPIASSGVDVLVQAVSGMGKTAVFVISTLQAIDESRNEVQALVLAHTRELSHQIFKEYKRFSKYMENVKLAVCIGGTNLNENYEDLKKGPQIVIGTPGRIQALIRDRHLNLKHLKHFILDECDKMLEADMRRDVQEIFKLCPYEKQVMMFTATLTPELRTTCKKFMTNPTEVLLTRNRLSLHGLLQHYVELKENMKNRKLGDLLDNLEFNQIVIFVKSVSRCKELENLLNELEFKSCSINSGMKQEDRIQVYENFKNFKFRILVSTDVFSRGMDIQRVNIVVNYDMPEDPATYLHRVGRAGRFGTKGLAISFVSTEADKEILRQVQSRFKAEMQPLPDELPRPNEYIG